jgi:hypothetical protein
MMDACLTQFVTKGRKKLLRPNIKGHNEVHRLPFVAKRIGKCDQPLFWDVPATGGYFGGYATGKAMALAYLKVQRKHGSPGVRDPLTRIAGSFMIRFEQSGGSKALREDCFSAEQKNDGMAALRGQYVGFFNTISQWLDLAAMHLGARLDQLDEDELLAEANAGLKFDHAAYMKSLSDDEDDESKKGGA